MDEAAEAQVMKSDHHSPFPRRLFYGWWIVAAAFLNLFFSVGIIYYGFPVYYPTLVAALGFTREEVTQGFLVGFLVVGIPFSMLAGVLIDRLGARCVILSGITFIGLPLILMEWITRFWQYEALCLLEVLGYSLTGPIANQVVISRWFTARRGQAMGLAYLGLGLGGVVAPITANLLIHYFGWRHALGLTGITILAVLFPVGFWILRSDPAEMGLLPDGFSPCREGLDAEPPASISTAAAIRTRDFWLILVGSTLVLGAINVVIQHFILFLKDQGYSTSAASAFLSTLLAASLAGRVLVGYLADRFQRSITMAFFYLLLGGAIPLLFWAQHSVVAWAFALIFGLAMGADYMLIPLVTADSFGLGSLGKLLALVLIANSILQWLAPWAAGKLFDLYGTYNPAWRVAAVAAIVGAACIYAVSNSSPPRLPGVRSHKKPAANACYPCDRRWETTSVGQAVLSESAMSEEGQIGASA